MVHEQHLHFFHFLGAVLAKAMFEGILVDIPFATFFLSKLKQKAFASSSDENDVVVIGGGHRRPAIKATQLGLKTTCIEKHGDLSGTCLIVGCIPSKALLYHEAKHSFMNNGVKFPSVEIYLPAMMAQKDKAVANLTRGVEGLFKKNKVTYVKGYGKLISPSEISVVKGKNIIIATGPDVKSHLVSPLMKENCIIDRCFRFTRNP